MRQLASKVLRIVGGTSPRMGATRARGGRREAKPYARCDIRSCPIAHDARYRTYDTRVRLPADEPLALPGPIRKTRGAPVSRANPLRCTKDSVTWQPRRNQNAAAAAATSAPRPAGRRAAVRG